jgi:hypothetical protein
MTGAWSASTARFCTAYAQTIAAMTVTPRVRPTGTVYPDRRLVARRKTRNRVRLPVHAKGRRSRRCCFRVKRALQGGGGFMQGTTPRGADIPLSPGISPTGPGHNSGTYTLHASPPNDESPAIWGCCAKPASAGFVRCWGWSASGCRGRADADQPVRAVWSLRRLWPVAMSCHSARQASSPRRWNLVIPRRNFVRANTVSMMC